MADYNKGDFTQQGIDGDVTALVRLNQKRIARLKLSSDDQTSGVTVSGYVYDDLNGEKYPIGGSQPTGTINITSNGTYDVSTYANAEVEVEGGSGLVLPITTTETVTLEYVIHDGYYSSELSQIIGLSDLNAQRLIITFDNVDYDCTGYVLQGIQVFGAPFENNTYDFTVYPFALLVPNGGSSRLISDSEGPHTIKISLTYDFATLTINTSLTTLDLTSDEINLFSIGAGDYTVLLKGGKAWVYIYEDNNTTLSFTDLVGCTYDPDEGALIVTSANASVRVIVVN